MKQLYVKPEFIKTLYLTIDSVADTTVEENYGQGIGIQALSASYNFIEGGNPTFKWVDNDQDICNCSECPETLGDMCAQACSDGRC